MVNKNTSVSLGDHFTSFVEDQVNQGRYGNISEVMRAGLRLLEDHEAQSAGLRLAIVQGEQSGISPRSVRVSAHPGWAATWSIDGGARASRRSTSTERPFAFAVLTTERNAA